jgi:hypothetical protein
MRSSRTIWTVLLALLAAFAPPRGDFQAEYAAATKDLVPKLEAFADWCATVKLYAERDKACEAILRFDASHEAAHRTLKHSRQRDGTWVVPEKRVESRNYGDKLKDGAAKRSAIVAEFRSKVVELVKAAGEALEPAQRDAIFADVLAIDAEDAGSRELVGEVRRDEQWVVKEALTSKESRVALKETIKTAVAGVPASSAAELRGSEGELKVAWTSMVALPNVRVLSSGGLPEAQKVATMCAATMAVFRKLTGATVEIPEGFTVYLLTTPVARDAFLANWPGWSDDERARLKTWAGAGVPGDIHQARWDADEARRLDGSVRHVIGLLTLLNYGYDHQKCAWAWEGVGLYLTREIVGTRYTWYSTGPATGDADAKELLGKLMMTDVNWMNECFQRAKRGKAPKIAVLAERKIDQFGVDEVLTSYALAAYLIEGRPDKLGAVLAKLGELGTVGSLEAALACDVARLDERFVRWLGERK